MKAKAMKPVKAWAVVDVDSGKAVKNAADHFYVFDHRAEAEDTRLGDERVQRVLITPIAGRKEGGK